jgi:hypothetical protein
MNRDLAPAVLGLPDDFELTEEIARDLQVDSFIASASLDLGLFRTAQLLSAPRDQAAESGNIIAANALQLRLKDQRTPIFRARPSCCRQLCGHSVSAFC